MTAIDVGEGDCILVETPAGRVMLIDGGGSRIESQQETETGEKVVVPYLRSRGIDKIDVLVITHPHGDHIGGLEAVVRDLQVDSVLDGTTLPYPSQTYRSLLDSIHGRHIPYEQARRGEKIDFGDGVRVEVLNPPVGALVYGTAFDDKTVNNYSAVVRLSYGRTVFLLDGDAEVEAEEDILAAYPRSYLRADYLKAGHHGSRNASGNDWLDAVEPKYAVISCGRNNLFHHPHPEALARLAAHHVEVLRTDQDGSVTAESNGRSVEIDRLGL